MIPVRRPRKRYFDENVPDDVQAVLDVSALLGIAEFRLFKIAYRYWHGEETDDDTVERHFIPYMFDDRVPFWVRHFTQHVQDLDRQGQLDPRAFGIRQRQASAKDVNKGRRYAFYLVTALTTLILLAELAANKNCMFPPCY